MAKEWLGLVCAQGWEQALGAELQAIMAGALEIRHCAPGLIAVPEDHALYRDDLVFARQWLPAISEISAVSIRETVEALGKLVDPILDTDPRPWGCRFGTTDFFTNDGATFVHVGSRASLLQEKFLERMTTYRRRAMDRFRSWTTEGRSAPPLRLQVFILDAQRLVVSLSGVKRVSRHLVVPLPWLSAHQRIPSDPQAPCRSYYKVEEAFAVAGAGPKPGDVCIDLGAAPGGWTWSALKRGARVVAVDFADLAAHVEHHPACEHLPDNGYAYMPERPVDWMFCDMIVRPMATLGLVERWLQAGLCRNFVVNVKFRGKDPSSILAAIQRLKETFHLKNLMVRHLFFDRNELTLIKTDKPT